MISEKVQTVVEIRLAYGSSAFAVGEALVTVGSAHLRHIVIDPFQQQAFSNVGWDLLCSAGLDSIATLVAAPSSIALSELVIERGHRRRGVRGRQSPVPRRVRRSYFLRKIVRAGGLVVADDDWTPSARTAVRYYERNLGWTVIPDAFVDGRLAPSAETRRLRQCPAARR